MADRIRVSLRCLVGLSALAAVLSVDLTPVRFPQAAAGRWIVLGALSVAGVWAGRTFDFGRLRVGERLLIASFAWVLIVAPMSPTPWRSTVVAAALSGTALVGIAVGRRVRWRDIQAATVAGLTAVLAVAAILGDRGSADGRWLGLSEEANTLGEVAAIAAVMGASMMVNRSWLGFPAVALGTLVLFQTAAAIPALGAALGMTVAAAPLLHRFWPRLGQLAPVAIGAAYAVAVAVVVVLDTEELGEQGKQLKTLNRRTGIWSYLADRIAERPITGFGPWGSQDLLAAAAFDGRVDWGPTHGHNVLVELATMGGLPAAGLFLAAMVATGWRLMQSRHAGIAVALTLLTMSMTEHLVAAPSIALLLFAAIAGASALDRDNSEPSHSDTTEGMAPSSPSA